MWVIFIFGAAITALMLCGIVLLGYKVFSIIRKEETEFKIDKNKEEKENER